jgi:hypothetical protein
MQQTTTTAAVPAQLTPEEIDAVILQAFGQRAADVVLPVKASAEAFGWLDAILRSIGDEARKDKPDSFRIRDLAGAGAYIAFDYSNCIGCQHEDMVDRLNAAKVYAGGVE